MRSVGADANGATGDDSTLTALADAGAQFKPDHILIALRYRSSRLVPTQSRLRSTYELPNVGDRLSTIGPVGGGLAA
jgi:hypothetical protein